MLVAAIAAENYSSLADVRGHYFSNSGFEVFLVLRPRELHGLLVFEKGHLSEELLDLQSVWMDFWKPQEVSSFLHAI